MSVQQGLRYDPVAEDYERGRTGWPPEIAAGVAGDTVLDLAAGTGKLTRVLVARFPHVVAVEPLDAMRAVGAHVVPTAEWLAGSAEECPLGAASVDAAFVAEAFHWFDSSRAVAEVARVVRPGGAVVVAFTQWDGAFEPGLPPDARAAVEEVSRRTGATGAPRMLSGAWRDGFAGAPFRQAPERELPFEHTTDRDGVIAYYLSMSTIASRPEDEREELRAYLRNAVPRGEHRLALRALVWSWRRDG